MKRILKINWGKYLEQLPKDWDIKKIGDIFRVTAGGDIDRKYVSKIKNEKYSVPIYANSLNDFGLYGYTTHPKVLNETITVTARGELGYVVPRYEPYYPIVRLLVLEPQKKCNIYFFSEILNSTRFYIEASGVPQLTAPQIRTYKIPVPPLREQDKIASILSTWDEAISLYQKLLKNKKAYRDGLLESIFQEIIHLDEEIMWEKYRLGDLGTFRTSSVDKVYRDKDEKVYILNYMDVYKNYEIDQQTSLEKGTATRTQMNTTSVNKGDIFFTPSSETRDDIGHASVVTEEMANTVYSYHLVRFQLNVKDVFDINFIPFCLNNQFVKMQMSRLCTGSTRYTLSIKDFENVLIKVPSMEIQKYLANIFSSLDKEIEMIKKLIDQLQEQKRGLMQLLLTGKVRV